MNKKDHKEQNEQKPRPSKNASLPPWDTFMTDVFQTKIAFFIGSRDSMCKMACEWIGSFGEHNVSKDETAKFSENLRAHFGREDRLVNGECLRVDIDNGNSMWIVRLNSFCGSVYDAALLSHECLHAALSILGYLGVDENHPHEVLCYLHEAIFMRFMKYGFEKIGMLRYSNDDERELS